VTFTPIEELTVPFDPSQLALKVRRHRRRMWSRVVSLAITVILLAGLYLWKRASFTGGYLTLTAVLVGISFAWCLGYLLAFRLAKRELARMGQGIAVRIGRPGVELRGVYVPWSEVTALRAVTGRWGRAPQLQLSRSSGEALAVPMNQIDVRPATLDLTARAYSAGRHGVDLSHLDS